MLATLSNTRIWSRLAVFLALVGVLSMVTIALPAQRVDAQPKVLPLGRCNKEARDVNNDAPKANDVPCDCHANNVDASNCPPLAYLSIIINILAAIVGIVVVIMIAYGGVQYTMAKDNPQQITEAREKIRNAVIAFLVYLFVYSFLQWIIPGGLF